jgi:hypothetical protein
MSAQIVLLAEVRNLRRDWTTADLAQFQRAANVLRQVGLPVDTDHGLSDEGDPWFVFFHAETGETFAHFARLNGVYIACAPHLDRSLSGRAFPDLVERFLDLYPTVSVSHLGTGGRTLYMAPLTALAALIATLFFVANPPAATSELPDTAGEAAGDTTACDIEAGSGDVLRLLAAAADDLAQRHAQRGGRDEDRGSTSTFVDRAGMIIAVLAATTALSLQDADASDLDSTSGAWLPGDLAFAGETGTFEIGDIVAEQGGGEAGSAGRDAQRKWLSETYLASGSSTPVRPAADAGEAGYGGGPDKAEQEPRAVWSLGQMQLGDVGMLGPTAEALEDAGSFASSAMRSTDGDRGGTTAVMTDGKARPGDGELDSLQVYPAYDRSVTSQTSTDPLTTTPHVAIALRDIFGSLDDVRSLLQPSTIGPAPELGSLMTSIEASHSGRSIDPSSLVGAGAEPAAASPDGTAAAEDPQLASQVQPVEVGVPTATEDGTGQQTLAGGTTGGSGSGQILGSDVDWQSVDAAIVMRLFLEHAGKIGVSEVGEDVVMFERAAVRAGSDVQMERLDLPGESDMILIGTKETFEEMAHSLLG